MLLRFEMPCRTRRHYAAMLPCLFRHYADYYATLFIFAIDWRLIDDYAANSCHITTLRCLISDTIIIIISPFRLFTPLLLLFVDDISLLLITLRHWLRHCWCFFRLFRCFLTPLLLLPLLPFSPPLRWCFRIFADAVDALPFSPCHSLSTYTYWRHYITLLWYMIRHAFFIDIDYAADCHYYGFRHLRHVISFHFYWRFSSRRLRNIIYASAITIISCHILLLLIFIATHTLIATLLIRLMPLRYYFLSLLCRFLSFFRRFSPADISLFFSSLTPFIFWPVTLLRFAFHADYCHYAFFIITPYADISLIIFFVITLLPTLLLRWWHLLLIDIFIRITLILSLIALRHSAAATFISLMITLMPFLSMPLIFATPLPPLLLRHFAAFHCRYAFIAAIFIADFRHYCRFSLIFSFLLRHFLRFRHHADFFIFHYRFHIFFDATSFSFWCHILRFDFRLLRCRYWFFSPLIRHCHWDYAIALLSPLHDIDIFIEIFSLILIIDITYATIIIVYCFHWLLAISLLSLLQIHAFRRHYCFSRHWDVSHYIDVMILPDCFRLDLSLMMRWYYATLIRRCCFSFQMPAAAIIADMLLTLFAILSAGWCHITTQLSLPTLRRHAWYWCWMPLRWCHAIASLAGCWYFSHTIHSSGISHWLISSSFSLSALFRCFHAAIIISPLIPIIMPRFRSYFRHYFAAAPFSLMPLISCCWYSRCCLIYWGCLLMTTLPWWYLDYFFRHIFMPHIIIIFAIDIDYVSEFIFTSFSPDMIHFADTTLMIPILITSFSLRWPCLPALMLIHAAYWLLTPTLPPRHWLH